MYSTPLVIHFRVEEDKSLCWCFTYSITRSPLTLYSGSALCRFEAHSSPDSTDADSLALCVMKIFTPVSTIKPAFTSRIPVPQGGELMTRYTRAQKGMGAARTLYPRPWTLNARATEYPVAQAFLHGSTVPKTAHLLLMRLRAHTRCVPVLTFTYHLRAVDP